ncbi:MAG: PEP-CTERM sorting domain-containing protein [Pyrinomonadaceae bacterium]
MSLAMEKSFIETNKFVSSHLIVPAKTLSLLVALLLLNFSVASAGPLLFVHDSSGDLGSVDVSNGAVKNVVRMRNAAGASVVMTDIAFAPNGNLFGITFRDLYRIDSLTGSADLIGRHGISQGNALVFGANKTLYAAGAGTTSLYTINTNSGLGTALAKIGFRSAGDLAFNDGHLFMSSIDDQLIKIDLAGMTSGMAIGAFGFRNVFGLATGDDKVLYGVAGTSIFSINSSTGVGTLVSDFSGQGLGRAGGSSFEAVPTPEPATMFLLGTGVAAAATELRRRSRRKKA